MNYKNEKIIDSIFIYLERKVKIQSLNPNICKQITSYINHTGVIKGKKTTNKNQVISLVEFKNYNRIWIKLNELEYL